MGQRIKVCLLEVNRTSKGPRVIVSRSHPGLLRRLFEMEVPEVYNGIVEIKSVAREAGYRSKVAVATTQAGIDPVGCCVGLRGIRIQNIVNELNGEKIDVVVWNHDPTIFIANALNPAHVLSVALNDGVATVVVPDRQLSLAIGKDGQNARLAAKLTGWRIDIKSISAAEAERAAEEKPLAEMAVEAAPEEAAAIPVEATLEPLAVTEEEAPTEAEEEAAPEEAAAIPIEATLEPLAVTEEEAPTEAEEEIDAEEEEAVPLVTTLKPLVAITKSQIRFAEDIFVGGRPRAGDRFKKKKGTQYRGRVEESTKSRSPRQAPKTT